MELKDFVKTTIADITNAVTELQAELKNGAIISPSIPQPIANSTIKDPDNENVNRRVSCIDFDVALTVGETGAVESGGKVGIQILSAKIGGESRNHMENASRITFSIPVVLPTAHVKSDRERFHESEEETKCRLRERRRAIDEEYAKDTTSS